MKFYERALDKFKQAESRAPGSYEVHKDLGFCNLFLARDKAAQYYFKKIYLFGKRDDLEEHWDQWQQGFPDKPVEVAPSHIRTVSLFTLDIEAPRYRYFQMAHRHIIRHWKKPGACTVNNFSREL